ncbi:hypothetical protein BV210_01550 [Halorientalis sp. IM1011]|uniref:hypothetical protein n=1 Tax=Halorientalis sp. IM1011 TaxID=1932360 RepID=UPI00097CC45C|nr:hypothetical protein [Halorientalis sp. IM1011]AQL41477.1 hypothetical protein BV210_01550 [Halorientalis sp. IM1011]
MLRGALQWLGARLGRDESDDEDESDDSRFVPSVLDASVRYAHGGSNTGLESEMAQIEEKAQVLEDEDRKR